MRPMLAQSTPSEGVTATGVVAVAVFLVIVFALGFAISRVHRIRHQRAWRPVLALVDGRVEPGVNPNTSVLRGTYRGHPLVATALPGSPLGPATDETVRYNRFVLRLFGLDGAASWQVMPHRHGWQIQTPDPELAARLGAAGLARMAADLRLPHDDPLPGISFDAAGHHVELNADAGPGAVPSPAELEALLAAVLAIAALNSSTNTG